MTHPPRTHIDWQRLIFDLGRQGVRHATVAARLGVTRTSVVHYQRGKTTPLHPTGELLIEFWCETTRRSREQVPRVETKPESVVSDEM
jgi:predicted transcriptional regulator